MTAEVFLAIIIICGIYVACEIVGKLIHYKVSPLVIFMFALVIFGGQLGILPNDLFVTAGFDGMVYSFGLPFVLAGFGTTMSVSSMKGEGRTVVTAIFAVICIMVLGLIAGLFFMDPRTAIYGAVEVAGSGQAGLIFLTHLKEIEGSEKLTALILCLMNMQILVGYPCSVIFMKKSMKMRIKNHTIPTLAAAEQGKEEQKKTLIKIPADIKNSFYYVFLMLGVICFLSAKLYELTTLSAYLWYIVLGFLFAELGILEHDCLGKAGLAPLMFGILYIVTCDAFLSLNIGDVGGVVVQFVILILMGVIACIMSGFIASKLFKIDICEGFATSIGCMVGYPASQKVAAEALQGVRADCEISEEDAQNLLRYYEPKVVISGIVTISLISGLLAGIVVSFL